ncbi:MAG: hypothetical protein NTW93_01995 [Phycisphaerae bacterium]|nr:hypothetical protein [Phycisphaerae bacterium]
MADQEKFESVSELLKQLENSLNKRIIKLEKELKERKKHAEDSRSQNLAKQYQEQCDNAVRFSEGLLADTSSDLKLVKQAKANLR